VRQEKKATEDQDAQEKESASSSSSLEEESLGLRGSRGWLS